MGRPRIHDRPMNSAERQKRYMAKLKAAADRNATDETVTNNIDIPAIVAWWKQASADERTRLWVTLYSDDDWNAYLDECAKLALEDWGYKKIGVGA